LDRLFADLGRLSGVEPPAVKLPLGVALALASAGRRVGGGLVPMPSVTEIRAASLNWAFRNTKAKRDLAWRPGPHEDCLEESIEWYRSAEGEPSPASRQPLPLRVTGGLLRRFLQS
jgi:dihydroflavonol-4-reductase